ncbi:hypothetical protein ACFE04_029417 [Oxalis oulophora]
MDSGRRYHPRLLYKNMDLVTGDQSLLIHIFLQSLKVGASQSSETSSFKRKRGMFQKDYFESIVHIDCKWQCLDCHIPLSKTVTLVEEIVVEYVTDLLIGNSSNCFNSNAFISDSYLILANNCIDRGMVGGAGVEGLLAGSAWIAACIALESASVLGHCN